MLVVLTLSAPCDPIMAAGGCPLPPPDKGIAQKALLSSRVLRVFRWEAPAEYGRACLTPNLATGSCRTSWS